MVSEYLQEKIKEVALLYGKNVQVMESYLNSNILYDYSVNPDFNDILNLFSQKDVIRAISMYEGETARTVASGIKIVSVHCHDYYNSDIIIKLVGSEGAAFLANKYDSQASQRIAGYLLEIAKHRPEDFHDVVSMAELAGEYNKTAVVETLFWISEIARQGHPFSTHYDIKKMLNTAGPKVAKLMSKYDGNDLEKISSRLAGIAVHSPETIEGAIDTIGKHDYETAMMVSYCFSEVLTYALRHIDDVVSLISKCDKNSANIIAESLTFNVKYTSYFGDMLEALSNEKSLELIKKHESPVSSLIAERLGKFILNEPDNIEMYCDFIGSSSKVSKRNLERVLEDVKKEDIKILAKESGSLAKKADSIILYRRLKEAGISVSQPSLDEKWFREAKNSISKVILKIYGAKVKNDLEYLCLLSIPKNSLEENDKVGIRKLLKNIPKKKFEAGKVYGKIHVSELEEKLDAVDSAKALVYALISQPFRKDKNGNVKARLSPLKLALKTFDKENVRKARNYIKGVGPGKLYAMLKDDLKGLEERNYSSVNLVLDKIRNEVVKKGDRKKVEPISDMLAKAEGVKESLSEVDYIMLKMQRGEISDLFDNRTTHCCAFYPDGANCIASIGYLKDPHIGLLHAKAFVNNEEVETAGVAIIVMAKDKKGDDVLLVDSVESGDTVSRSGKVEEFNQKYFNALIKIAEEQNVKKIVFNSSVANSGPKNFNKFLESKGLKKETLWLRKKGNVKEDFYLEIFNGLGRPGKSWKSYVEGYVARLG